MESADAAVDRAENEYQYGHKAQRVLGHGIEPAAQRLGAGKIDLLQHEVLFAHPEEHGCRQQCTQEKFDFMVDIRQSGEDKIEPYADKFGVEFFPSRKPWEVSGDVAIPCATQNEINVEDAVRMIANGVRYYVEAANMPATADALRLLRLSPEILTAAGSGGVAVSALEMAQNSIRYSWTRKEVDERLRAIMSSIYDASDAAADQYGLGYDLIAGNDIASFQRIAQAMMDQDL